MLLLAKQCALFHHRHQSYDAHRGASCAECSCDCNPSLGATVHAAAAEASTGCENQKEAVCEVVEAFACSNGALHREH
eukprot:1435734-Amphidinium_carterae.1